MHISLLSWGLLIYLSLTFAHNPQRGSIPSKNIIEKDPSKALPLVSCAGKKESFLAQEIRIPASRKLWQRDKRVCFKTLCILYEVCLLTKGKKKKSGGEVICMCYDSIVNVSCILSNGKGTIMHFYKFFLFRDIQNTAKDLTEVWLVSVWAQR